MLKNFHKVLKIIKNPGLAAALLNAQLRMATKARVPLSVRLKGSVRITGAGELVFGKGVSLLGTVVPIEFASNRGGRILIGNHTFINYGSTVSAYELVSIGAHCLLGHYTHILDNNEHGVINHNSLPPSKSVVIEDHVWICARVMVLPGVRIGHHSVIGAGSVVNKSIPPRSLAVGNPARVVRKLEAPISTCDASGPSRATDVQVGLSEHLDPQS